MRSGRSTSAAHVAHRCWHRRVGALQYAWNFRGFWTAVEPPAIDGRGHGEVLVRCDEADWRETIVMKVSEAGLKHDPPCTGSTFGSSSACQGCSLRRSESASCLARPRLGVLLVLTYVVNLAFAWTYNVGDAYIFFLPSHYVLAISRRRLAAGVLFRARRIARSPWLQLRPLLLYPIWRGYDTFPAVDRSHDHRAMRCSITSRRPHPRRPRSTASTRTGKSRMLSSTSCASDVRHSVVHDRRARLAGAWKRRRTLPETARRQSSRSAAKCSRLRGCTGGFESSDTREESAMSDFSRRLEDLATCSRIASGRLRRERLTCLVFCDPTVSTPSKRDPATLGLVIADRGLDATCRNCASTSSSLAASARPPLLVRTSDQPYRVQTRRSSPSSSTSGWNPGCRPTPFDASGFGHVIADRQHVLTLERGISFVALGPGG